MSGEFSAQQYAMMARLVPGSQLAGYVIEEQVGAGGMAVVFRARDGMLGRLAALKVLSPSLAANQEFRTRFLRESRAVASVEEPHIIPVYGAGEVDGVLYIATKFVSGGDLADVLQRAGGALEPGRSVAFIEQVGAALDAAHAAGLVHRDVKPGNVLVDVVPGRDEHAYLSDFGLSKPSMAVSGLTATGTFLGTPDYAAPEQIKGLPVDGRGDQYSLACMAFALLTGNLPFRRPESMATLFAHLNDPVPPVTRFRGDLPPGTDAVLARGLAKEPRERYESCGAFAAALRNVLTAVDRSRPPHAPETVVWPGPESGLRPGPETTPTHQPTWAAQPTAGLDRPAPAFPMAGAPGAGAPGAGASSARPAPQPAAPPAAPRYYNPRPNPPPPPAAGQGGKLPLVSRSAVIATLAAVAAFAVLIVLHMLGIGG
jgi:serine/threonine-protein kinase